MNLKTIEYGSIASSDLLNDNFLYLDDKISTSESELNTNISSILSNIATINNRLIEMTDSISDFITDINSKIDELKAKTTITINKSSLIPDWSKMFPVSSLLNYEATANGYVVILSENVSEITLTINGQVFENINNPNFVVLPVKDGDILNCTSTLDNIYFLPVMRFSLENLE